MKAFILAAGFGDRLRPITDHIPKPLVTVLNLPALVYAIALVKEAGIRNVVVNVHYLPGNIISYLKNYENFGLDLSFSVEEEILGTGGGLMRCRDLLEDDDVLLVNSDVICDLSAAQFIRSYQESGAPGMVALYRAQADIATVSVRDGLVSDFRGVLGSGIAPVFDYAGIAVFSPAIFEYLSAEFSSVVYTGFTGLVVNHSLACYEHAGLWMDIGTPRSLLEANLAVLKPDSRALLRRVEQQTGLRPEAVSGRAVIEPGASVENSVIGEGVRVAAGARVYDSVVYSGSVEETADMEHCFLFEGHRLV